MAATHRLFINPRFAEDAEYGAEARGIVGLGGLDEAWRAAREWPGYAPTPLRRLAALARRLGVAEIRLKDESARFDLGSFKAIGAAYGAGRAVGAALEARFGIDANTAALRRGEYRDATAAIVLTCATDGNHGRAVAWAARTFGCPCVVYVPRIVSPRRRAAIEAEGAEVIAVEGTYDEALRACGVAAAEHRRLVVSDQAYPGYEAIPADIMQGYAIVAAEALERLSATAVPTHVFVQAGVGGFAAAVCGHLWERFGPRRPVFVCVEPTAADCLYGSAVAGRPVAVPGELDTVMGCLSCGEVSPLAWKILASGARGFLAIDDEWVPTAMRALAMPRGRDPALAIGESGAAGVAGLMAVSADALARRQLELGPQSRVLLFATEGANDPDAYRSIVGRSPDDVGDGARETRG